MRKKMQFKKIALLAPKPDLTFEAFLHHWRGAHGRVVATAPGYARYREKYVQNHIAAPGPFGGSFPFGGVAEFWLPGENEPTFARSATYLDHIRPDEERFIDMDRTVSVTALEHVVIDGSGPAKLIVFSARREDLTSCNFRDQISSGYAKAVDAPSEIRSLLRGFVLNFVAEGSMVLPGARTAKPMAIDCVEEFWFDSHEDIDRAFRMPAYRDVVAAERAKAISPAGQMSFVARELVFFDRGAPTALALS